MAAEAAGIGLVGGGDRGGDLVPGSTPYNPIAKEGGTRDLSGNGWTYLLAEINTAGKYMELDLSTCTMGGLTEFNPENTVSIGKKYIVSLTLPNGATSIRAGASYSDSTFKHFTCLKSITGMSLRGANPAVS